MTDVVVAARAYTGTECLRPFPLVPDDLSHPG